MYIHLYIHIFCNNVFACIIFIEILKKRNWWEIHRQKTDCAAAEVVEEPRATSTSSSSSSLCGEIVKPPGRILNVSWAYVFRYTFSIRNRRPYVIETSAPSTSPAAAGYPSSSSSRSGRRQAATPTLKQMGLSRFFRWQLVHACMAKKQNGCKLCFNYA